MLRVGEKFTLFRQRVAGVASVMELLDGGTFLIVIYIPDMTIKESEMLRNTPMNVRIIRDGDYADYLVRFGDSEMIFELTFDPTVYPEKKQQEILESNLVVFVGVDSTTNEIKTLRMANMPKIMYETVIDVLYKAKNYKGLYSTLYKTFIEIFCLRYSVKKLWEIATPAGKMGE